MNIFWETPELVGLIMEAVARPSKKECKNALLACYTVNRCFSREALRIAWRELGNLDPLIRLLPPEAVSIIINAKGRLVLEFRRDLEVADWDRILYYTQFVRAISWTQWDTASVSFTKSESRFLQLYATFFPDSFILPGLLRLEGIRLKEPSAAVLLPPSLRHIRVHLQQDTRLGVKSLVLKRIREMELLERIDLGQAIEISSEDLSQFLEGALYLTDLALPDPITYHHLSVVHSAVPNLERLAIATDMLSGSGNSAALEFPRLKVLDLRGPLKGSVHVIRTLRIHPLETLAVTRTGELLHEWCSELLIAIGEIESSSLCFLDVRVGHWKIYPSKHLDHDLTGPLAENYLDGNIINPLLKFRELQVLKLRFGLPILFGDDDVKEILRAFPQICHLHIMGMSEPANGLIPRLTPACLKQFAFAAPQLRSLSVWLLPEWDKLAELRDGSTSPSRLRKLNIKVEYIGFRSHFYQELGVWDIIESDCFPNLKYVVYDTEDELPIVRPTYWV